MLILIPPWTEVCSPCVLKPQTRVNSLCLTCKYYLRSLRTTSSQVFCGLPPPPPSHTISFYYNAYPFGFVHPFKLPVYHFIYSFLCLPRRRCFNSSEYFLSFSVPLHIHHTMIMSFLSSFAKSISFTA